MNDLTTERSFDLQATRVIYVLGLFFTYYQWVFEQPDTVADVRSTGAGIKCLYCGNMINMSAKAQERKDFLKTV